MKLDQTPAGFPPLFDGRFGYALASGDFDLDGDADLAAGAPGYDVDTVFYGDHAEVRDDGHDGDDHA